MSDVSILSHEYKAATELSQTINRALILLKKTYYKLPGAEGIPPDQLEASLQCLVKIIGSLVRLLGPERATDSGSASVTHLPAAFVAKLRSERRGDLAYYHDDLEGTIRRLGGGPSQLTKADLSILDQLAAAADAETSEVFRRLMRK